MARRVMRGAWLAAGVLAACAAGPRWTDEVAPGGLVRVEGSGIQAAWAQPDWDWTRYRRVKLEAFAPEPDSRASEVELQERRRVVAVLQAALARAISESNRLELVAGAGAGPDVLVLRPTLRDLRLSWDRGLQPDLRYYAHRVGSGTLEVQVQDGLTRVLLARSVDRCIAQRTDPGVRAVGLPARFPELEDSARSWARRVSQRLEWLVSSREADSPAGAVRGG